MYIYIIICIVCRCLLSRLNCSEQKHTTVCPKCGYSATRTCGDLINNMGITTKSKAKNMGQEPNPNLEMEANHDMLHPVLHSMPIPHLVGLSFIFCWLQQ